MKAKKNKNPVTKKRLAVPLPYEGGAGEDRLVGKSFQPPPNLPLNKGEEPTIVSNLVHLRFSG